MIYNCVRCGYETKHKGHFKNHLNRKNICIPLIEDISINNIKIYYNLELDTQPKNNPEQPNKILSQPILTQNIGFSCNYCNKIFKRQWHLSRHLNTCKIKKVNLNKEKNEIDILKKQQKQ